MGDVEGGGWSAGAEREISPRQAIVLQPALAVLGVCGGGGGRTCPTSSLGVVHCYVRKILVTRSVGLWTDPCLGRYFRRNGGGRRKDGIARCLTRRA